MSRLRTLALCLSLIAFAPASAQKSISALAEKDIQALARYKGISLSEAALRLRVQRKSMALANLLEANRHHVDNEILSTSDHFEVIFRVEKAGKTFALSSPIMADTELSQYVHFQITKYDYNALEATRNKIFRFLSKRNIEYATKIEFKSNIVIVQVNDVTFVDKLLRTNGFDRFHVEKRSQFPKVLS